MPSSNSTVAHEIQLKHQFYVLTLCFTILALAVQTARFDRPLAANCIELLAWLCLLVSAVIGLYRFELIPKLYRLFDARSRLENDQRGMVSVQTLADSADPEDEGDDSSSIDEVVARVNSDLQRVNAIINDRQHRITGRYVLHRSLLVIGIVLLAVSRGFVPLAEIWSTVTEALSNWLE